MKIRDILKRERSLSFEFYPPKEAEGVPAVFRVMSRLGAFKPSFISITYGAGGTTRALTVEIATRAKRETDHEVMAHLTCAAQTAEEVHEVLVRLQREGIENVIALRGDPPRGQGEFVPKEGGFANATDLIRHIKAHFDFGLAGACYPEPHPEAVDARTDLEYAKMKVDLGAEFLITQLFYDNRDFYEFVDKARKIGIAVPILAGLLPIISTRQIRRFTSLCGATIPPELDKQLEAYADDDDAVRELGAEHTTAQARDLWDNGVEGIHFYVLNRSYSVAKVLSNIGLPEHAATP